jgi:ATP-dependent DNA ligase
MFGMCPFGQTAPDGRQTLCTKAFQAMTAPAALPCRRGRSLDARIRNFRPSAYLAGMGQAFEFCLPTRGTQVPSSPDWLHEVKYDGYRMMVVRDGVRVRLISRNGYEWTKRFPWIAETALKIKTKQFVIDGEAVVLGVDGIANFEALHSRKHDHEVQLYAFDALARTATTCLTCRSRCARPISRGCWRDGRMASSSRRSKRARSGRTCFAPPAGWG